MEKHWLCGETHELDGPPKIIHCPMLVALTSDLPILPGDIAKRAMMASRAIANLIIQWDTFNESIIKSLTPMNKMSKILKGE